MSVGTPKRVNHFSNSALAQESAVASDIGMASGQRVKRSTIVNKYDVPYKTGSDQASRHTTRWVR